jgi:D-alanine---(R)-lactate ligase
VNKVKIGIIFGGCSEEHPVSVKSAQEVAKHLDRGKYDPLWIGVTTSGAWQLCDGPAANWEGPVTVRSSSHPIGAFMGCSFWTGNGTR